MKEISQNNFLQRFPANSLWRLLIDGNRQATSGPLGFDRKEPGYLKGMMHGLDLILSDDSKLSIEYLTALHDCCTAPVRMVQHAETVNGVQEFRMPFNPGIDNSPKSFGLIPEGPCKNFTKEGLSELCNKLLSGKSSFYFERTGTMEQIKAENLETLNDLDALYEKLQSGDWVIATTHSPRTNPIRDQLNTIIRRYEQNIKLADSDEMKIEVIATCVHELELAHPFSDANCRTIVVLLLNKLLLEQNLSPVILENPNRFDAYSISELCDEIRHGMEKFQQCIHDDKIKNNRELSLTTAVYLKDNPTLQEFIFESALASCSNWNDVHSTEKKRTTELIMQGIKELNIDELTPKQLNDLTEKLAVLVNQSIYQKHYLQKSLKSNNNYGVRFAGDLGSWGGLNLKSIKTCLNECIKSPKMQSDYKESVQRLRDEASASNQQNQTSTHRPH